jgi:hypothetical protein
MHFLKLYCFRRFCVCVLVFHVVPMNFQGIFWEVSSIGDATAHGDWLGALGVPWSRL